MSSFATLFLIFFVSCAAVASAAWAAPPPPPADERPPVLHLPRDAIANPSLGLFGTSGYGKLVGDLIESLRVSAACARDALATFRSGVQEEIGKSQAQFAHKLEELREKVAGAVGTVSDRFLDSGSAVRQCIAQYKGEGDALFDTAMQKTKDCTNEKLEEAAELFLALTNVTDGAQQFAASAAGELRSCTQSAGSFLSIGSCLAAVAMKTEMKGAVFLGQSGLSLGRINLFMATLPASLQVCAGSGLVSAGAGAARIVMDVGGCSASSVFSTLTGTTPSLNLPLPAVPDVPSIH